MMMMTRNNCIDIAEMRTSENIECNVQYQILTETHKTNGKNAYNRSRPLYVKCSQDPLWWFRRIIPPKHSYIV